MNMELKMLKDYVLIKEEENPFIERKTSSGIITSIDSVHYDSEESGQMEQLNRIIGFGVVINVGPDVKYVKVGDGVYYDRRSMRALPFGTEPGWHINEANLLGYVSDEAGSVAAVLALRKAEAEAEARKAALANKNVGGFNITSNGLIN